MAKQRDKIEKSDIPADLATAQREYAELSSQCAAFDRQTTAILAEHDKRRQLLSGEREQLRRRLLDRKGVIHRRIVELSLPAQARPTRAAAARNDDAAMTSLSL